MNLKLLRIRNYRGIRRLDWTLGGATFCLVGAGDSTKTTILDAIEWVLSPRWSLPVADTDFYMATPDDPIVIEVTVGDLPDSLLSDQKFGLEQRGWGAGELHDEPEETDESVITVRLTIDDSLEPRWEVVNDRQPEPKRISVRDRESLGVTRVDDHTERHLTWGRASALLRLTGSTDEMGRTLAAAHRNARQAVDTADLTNLTEAAERASEAARALGAGGSETYQPALDPGTIGLGAAALGLHEGPIPVRSAGLGTRRLAALAVQRVSFPEGGIVLVDEIEAGLEPHRLRHLLRVLRTDRTGQVLMTTHSPIPLVELSCADLRVVARQGGTTTVRVVPNELQAPVRAAPEALLGRRVIVGEGKTEVGLCRALDAPWADARGTPPADLGVVLVPGGGASNAPQNALAFASLGYRTALLADSDRPLDPSETELAASGVEVFTWDGGVSTEERVMLDVPWDALIRILDLARGLMGEGASQAINDAVATRLNAQPGSGPEEWIVRGFDAAQIRRACGQAAKANVWFKRTDRGEALGAIVVASLPEIPETDLAIKLAALADWAYAP